MNSLISDKKRQKKTLQIHPLLSHQLLQQHTECPETPHDRSRSLLNTSSAGEWFSGNVDILRSMCHLCIAQWSLHVGPSRWKPRLWRKLFKWYLVLHKEHSQMSPPLAVVFGAVVSGVLLFWRNYHRHHSDKHHPLRRTAAVHGLFALNQIPVQLLCHVPAYSRHWSNHRSSALRGSGGVLPREKSTTKKIIKYNII